MKQTILFADDELHFIEGLIETVKAEGFEVLTCRDASKAVELTTTRKVDCLVIDIMMDPGKNLSDKNPQAAGLAAIDEILRLRPYQSIVCCSVVSDPKVIKRLRGQNVLYLRKAETTVEAALRAITAKATGVYRDRSK
jgi:CheY-like chemotaxis protein